MSTTAQSSIVVSDDELELIRGAPHSAYLAPYYQVLGLTRDVGCAVDKYVADHAEQHGLEPFVRSHVRGRRLINRLPNPQFRLWLARTALRRPRPYLDAPWPLGAQSVPEFERPKMVLDPDFENVELLFDKWGRPLNDVETGLNGRLTNEKWGPNSAVGILVYDAVYNRILLVDRKDCPPGKGWSIPGGMIDAGHTITQTAHKELCEETGIAENYFDLGKAPIIYAGRSRLDPRTSNNSWFQCACKCVILTTPEHVREVERMIRDAKKCPEKSKTIFEESWNVRFRAATPRILKNLHSDHGPMALFAIFEGIPKHLRDGSLPLDCSTEKREVDPHFQYKIPASTEQLRPRSRPQAVLNGPGNSHNRSANHPHPRGCVPLTRKMCGSHQPAPESRRQ